MPTPWTSVWAAPTRSGSATGIYLFSLTQDVPGVPAPELSAPLSRRATTRTCCRKLSTPLRGARWYLHTDTAATGSPLRHRSSSSSKKPRTRSAHKAAQGPQRSSPNVQGRRTQSAQDMGGRQGSRQRSEDAWLVILHWDDFGDHRGVDPRRNPDEGRGPLGRTPAGGHPRIPQPARHPRALPRHPRSDGPHCPQHLALRRLTATPKRVAAPREDKRAELKNRLRNPNC